MKEKLKSCPQCGYVFSSFKEELSVLMFDTWGWSATTFEEDLQTIVELHEKYKEVSNE